MKIAPTAREFGQPGRKVCLAIGVFDGIHLGHRQIIRQTVTDARQHDALAVVVTFDQHPHAIVAPEHVPPQIFTRSQKLRAVASLGVEGFLEIPFNREFSQKSGEEFIRELARDLGPIRSICVGADFVFGRQRSGNVALLKQLGGELHFQVHGLAAVALDGQVISSTRIREAIRTGDLDAASQMLGQPYALCGPVVTGDQLGRQLGFPTANLDVPGLILPPNGVYAATTVVGGARYRVALNIGLRPTVASNQPKLRVEAHLLDFSGDLYGVELEVEVGPRLRDERRFDSVAELKSQLERDILAVRAES